MVLMQVQVAWFGAPKALQGVSGTGGLFERRYVRQAVKQTDPAGAGVVPEMLDIADVQPRAIIMHQRRCSRGRPRHALTPMR